MTHSLARGGVGLVTVALVYLLGLVGVHIDDTLAAAAVVATVAASDFVLHNGGLVGVAQLVLHGRPKPPAA